MDLVIHSVETHLVQQMWPHVVGYFEDALAKSGSVPDYNIHHIQMFLTGGQWLMLVAVDDESQIHGAASVSFMNYPLSRVAFVTAIGGKLISSEETFEQLKTILKQRGATKIQGFGRDAIVRLWKRYGFEPKTTLVEVPL
jgi:hypothetical protein